MFGLGDTGGVVASDGVSLEVMSREAPVVVLMASRSPRLKTTLVREVSKPKKDK